MVVGHLNLFVACALVVSGCGQLLVCRIILVRKSFCNQLAIDEGGRHAYAYLVICRKGNRVGGVSLQIVHLNDAAFICGYRLCVCLRCICTNLIVCSLRALDGQRRCGLTNDFRCVHFLFCCNRDLDRDVHRRIAACDTEGDGIRMLSCLFIL